MSLRGYLERGCLPVATDPARGMVVLSPVADLAFTEARYDATLLTHGRRRPAHLVPIGEFVDAVATLAPTPPAGVIAHVGRCGSTLLANLLGLRRSALVIKEPGFLHTPDRPLLAALLTWCRAVSAAAARELVVKPSSWTCPALRQAAAPSDARWLLLWRDPTQVVASELASPPPWVDADNSRAELARRVARVPDAPAARYAAHWADIVRAFLGCPDDVRFLDYRRLAADKPATVRAAQAWFGLRNPDELPDGFDAEAVRYAKTTGANRFNPGGPHHRPALSPADTAEVNRITGAELAGLRELDPELLLSPWP